MMLDTAERQDTLRYYPPAQLKPWEGVNPRKRFDPEKMGRLQASIAQKGVRQPLLVHVPSEGDDWSDPLIIAGESRWRCAMAAGVESVPCMVGTYTFAEALEIALLENVARNDLTPIEEARGFRAWLDANPTCTQEQLATRIGKSQSYISNLMRLLKLPAQVIELVDEGRVHPSHARDHLLPLAGLSDDMPEHAFRRLLSEINGLPGGEKVEGTFLEEAAGRIRAAVEREYGPAQLFEAEPSPAAAPPQPQAEAVAPAATAAPESLAPAAAEAAPAAPVPAAPAPKPAPAPASSPSPAPAAPAEPVSTLPPPTAGRAEVPEGAGLIAALLAATGGRPGTIAYHPLPDGRVAVTVAPKIMKTGERTFALTALQGEIDALLVPAVDTHFAS